MPQNGLLRCPEETIKWLSCFKATSLSAGAVMMGAWAFGLAEEGCQWDSACVTQLPDLLLHGPALVLAASRRRWYVYMTGRAASSVLRTISVRKRHRSVCARPVGRSGCQSYGPVMSSIKRTDTPLPLLNKSSAQRGGRRSLHLKQLMMTAMLCVLKVCACSLAPPCFTNDRRKRNAVSWFFFFFVGIVQEGSIVVLRSSACVCLCVFCLLNVLLFALIILGPDVLIAELCQQSGHKTINEACNSIRTPVSHLRVFMCTSVFVK